MKLLLQCKHCGNKMQYETRSSTLTDQTKKCVYCGKSFDVRAGLRERIN